MLLSEELKETEERAEQSLNALSFIASRLDGAKKDESAAQPLNASLSMMVTEFGKKIPSYLSILLVWFLLGLWHGGILYFFVASAAIPCFYLIAGDFFEPQFKKLKELLRIKDTNPVFRVFQSVRTTFLICICWVFICTESVADGVKALGCIFKNMLQNPNIMGLLSEAGIGMGKLLVLVVCVVALFVVDYFIYKKKSVTQWLENRFFLIRWGFLYAALLLILLYGMVGTSSFIYFQF